VESKLARLTVDISCSGGTDRIAHARLNVIDIPMMEELAQALADIESRSQVSLIVLSGEGKAFSAGRRCGCAYS
jgi:1,4-dihydroxy-2-naphthoyl-CoA synthase